LRNWRLVTMRVGEVGERGVAAGLDHLADQPPIGWLRRRPSA
jgi:hypothetical protein